MLVVSFPTSPSFYCEFASLKQFFLQCGSPAKMNASWHFETSNKRMINQCRFFKKQFILRTVCLLLRLNHVPLKNSLVPSLPQWWPPWGSAHASRTQSGHEENAQRITVHIRRVAGRCVGCCGSREERGWLWE